MNRLFSLTLSAALALTLSACSSFNYNGYHGEVDPAAMQPYDLSANAPNAPLVFFNTFRVRELGVPFHRLLLATQVDGQPLPGAGKAPLFDFHGYQALKLTPGKHSLQWCWVSKSSWGTGGGSCGLGASDIEFEAGKRYLVTWDSSSNDKYFYIYPRIENLDTHEVIYRAKTAE